MGPVIEPVSGKLERGLTELGEGESWLVKPRQLDETDRLWSPGVRDGVARGQRVPPHRVLRAGARHHDRADARRGDRAAERRRLRAHRRHPLARRRRGRASGSTRVEAGNLYVNRPITGAIVRRQPFGGWKRSTVGAERQGGRARTPCSRSAPGSRCAVRAGRRPAPRRARPARRGAHRGRASRRSTIRDFDRGASRRAAATPQPGRTSSASPVTSRRSASSATCSATGRRR